MTVEPRLLRIGAFTDLTCHCFLRDHLGSIIKIHSLSWLTIFGATHSCMRRARNISCQPPGFMPRPSRRIHARVVAWSLRQYHYEF